MNAEVNINGYGFAIWIKEETDYALFYVPFGIYYIWKYVYKPIWHRRISRVEYLKRR